jgi:hypothetical protein
VIRVFDWHGIPGHLARSAEGGCDVGRGEILWISQTIPFIKAHWADVPNLPRTIMFDTVEAVLEFDPQSVIGRISPRPLLMLAVERDQIVPNEETTSAFAEAGEPKKLVWLPRALGHWGAYVGEGFECVRRESVDWFRQWLPAWPARAVRRRRRDGTAVAPTAWRGGALVSDASRSSRSRAR